MQKDYRFQYMLLDRMRQDCKYYLRNGRSPHCLFMENEQAQIDKMIELYNTVPEKPEWLSMDDIMNFKKQMGL